MGEIQESYLQKSKREMRAKLEAYIASDPEDLELPSFWDILGIPNGTYSSAVDEHIIYVIERMIPNPHAAYSSDIAKERGWPEEYVELIKYILCSANLAEYGTSPRGAWIDHGLADLMPGVIARWRADWTS